jgi:hypothetical protein
MTLTRLTEFLRTPVCGFIKIHALGSLLVITHAFGMANIQKIVFTAPPESLLNSHGVLWGYFIISFMAMLWLFFAGIDHLVKKHTEI